MESASRVSLRSPGLPLLGLRIAPLLGYKSERYAAPLQGNTVRTMPETTDYHTEGDLQADLRSDLALDARLGSAVAEKLGPRSIVLVGMMGAGKSTIGRRLGQRLALPFIDADTEIEAAAGMTIPDIFMTRGEHEFRAGEARVIARLLEGGPQVLATGGGAFMHAETRALIANKAISMWLRADFDVLMRRVRRRVDRPLLKTADPEGTLRRLIAERDPVYAQAKITIESRDVSHDTIVDEIFLALCQTLDIALTQSSSPEQTSPES